MQDIRRIFSFLTIVLIFTICARIIRANSVEDTVSADAAAAPAPSIFQDFEKLFAKVDPQEAIRFLKSKARIKSDQRKRIDITCPGPDPPIVQVLDYTEDELDPNIELNPEDDEADVEKPLQTECLQINVRGANFDLSMDLKC